MEKLSLVSKAAPAGVMLHLVLERQGNEYLLRVEDCNHRLHFSYSFDGVLAAMEAAERIKAQRLRGGVGRCCA